MAQKTSLALFYETLLTVTGMNEPVKVDLKLNRKSVFLLSKVIERGLRPNGEEKDEMAIMGIAPQDTIEDLNSIPEQLLQKAELWEMNEKLAGFKQ